MKNLKLIKKSLELKSLEAGTKDNGIFNTPDNVSKYGVLGNCSGIATVEAKAMIIKGEKGENRSLGYLGSVKSSGTTPGFDSFRPKLALFDNPMEIEMTEVSCDLEMDNGEVQGRPNLRDKKTATASSDVVQSGRPIFDDFFQHLWPSVGNNTANVVFQMVKRLWLIRIDQ
ncbi:hypothetical protein TNCV_4286181 [Trichonephila clavipes]|nr:hypothetical protein TNCV_4286181 [Trichonephila clavipes]